MGGLLLDHIGGRIHMDQEPNPRDDQQKKHGQLIHLEGKGDMQLTHVDEIERN